MNTVRLPIYDGNIQTRQYLEIDIRHFLGAAGSEVAHNYMKVVTPSFDPLTQKIIDDLKAQEAKVEVLSDIDHEAVLERRRHTIKAERLAFEKDQIDRIICDLPVKVARQELLGEWIKPEESWHTLPKPYRNYEISEPGHGIRNRWTKDVVELGFDPNGKSEGKLWVQIHNDDGTNQYVHIHDIITTVFK